MMIYRTMRADPDGHPLVADTTSGLGVRDWEIEQDEDMAIPEAGGMSVAPDSPLSLPRAFRPKELRGLSRHPAWELDVDDLGEALVYRPDPDDPTRHGFVEPSRPMRMEEYRYALAETRTLWHRVT
jgi:hypothetical protein